MEIEIKTAVDGVADEVELRSLRDWLMQESPSPGAISTRQGRAEAGEMGGMTDAVTVALGSGGAIAVLAGSVSTWIQTRRQSVKMVLRRPGGAELEIAGSVKDPEAMIERFLKAASEE
jgi:hypothetical protein